MRYYGPFWAKDLSRYLTVKYRDDADFTYIYYKISRKIEMIDFIKHYGSDVTLTNRQRDSYRNWKAIELDDEALTLMFLIFGTDMIVI